VVSYTRVTTSAVWVLRSWCTATRPSTLPILERSSNQTSSLEGESVNVRQGTWKTLVVHSGERLRDETGGPGMLMLSAKGIPERRAADAGTSCVDA
jgi:hypothetical protein